MEEDGWKEATIPNFNKTKDLKRFVYYQSLVLIDNLGNLMIN